MMITFKANKDIKKGEWLVAIDSTAKVEIAYNEECGVSVEEEKKNQEKKEGKKK